MKNINTIKTKRNFDFLFRSGIYYRFPFISVIVYDDVENDILGDVAFVASKKNGNSVWRNKNKRKLRELYKLLLINENIKLLLIANKKTLDYKNSVIAQIINDKVLNNG